LKHKEKTETWEKKWGEVFQEEVRNGPVDSELGRRGKGNSILSLGGPFTKVGGGRSVVKRSEKTGNRRYFRSSNKGSDRKVSSVAEVHGRNGLKKREKRN